MKQLFSAKHGKLAGVVAMCALTCSLMSLGFAFGPQDFTLHNNTTKVVSELYVSPHDTDEWEEDVLGDDVLGDGEEVDISFDRTEDADNWDLKVVFDDGKSSVWSNLKLTQITDLTISYKKGKPWATWKNGG